MPPGGTIGRGTDNNLVLPDDNRTISRLQAIVHFTADGECHITNRGNVTLVHLNDIPLERGRQVELQDGDILSIDEYHLLVTSLRGDQKRCIFCVNDMMDFLEIKFGNSDLMLPVHRYI